MNKTDQYSVGTVFVVVVNGEVIVVVVPSSSSRVREHSLHDSTTYLYNGLLGTKFVSYT